MAGFIQIVEYKSSRPDEMTALAEQAGGDREQGTARSVRVTADRDRPGYYLVIAEFDSYEAAMENSSRPETSDFAGKMAALCDGKPKFYNLDVQDSWGR